ncbi:MAG: hypothetical protein LBL66_03310 [Clostridiales bacterium]|nr:hypothetical protein [Clostridiales bacterium]
MRTIMTEVWRVRIDRGARGVPLSGSDCRVALRAPRNDTWGVRAPRNDRGFTRNVLCPIPITYYLLLITSNAVALLHRVQNAAFPRYSQSGRSPV